MCAIFVCTFLSSCHSTHSDEITDEESVVCNFTDFQIVQGSLDESLTRGTTAEQKYSLLAVDVLNGTYIQSVSRIQQPESEVLADLSMSLSVGKHDIYFICGTNQWHSFDEKSLLVSWNETTAILGDVWSSHVEVTVTPGVVQNKSVDLQRAVAMVVTCMTDTVPASVNTLQQVLMGGSWTYNLSKMSGDIPATISKTISFPTTMIGTSNVKSGIYTFIPAGYTMANNYTITALDASSNTIVSHSFSSVPLTLNRYTMYKGKFFVTDTSFGLDLKTEWGADNVITF
ncbi:MAG: hypothetical protein IJP70_05270 [Bacteroidales bacterium]|nr:hypothetical protein [Bacteroidales bacterium]